MMVWHSPDPWLLAVRAKLWSGLRLSMLLRISGKVGGYLRVPLAEVEAIDECPAAGLV